MDHPSQMLRPRRTLNQLWSFYLQEPHQTSLAMLCEVYSARDFWNYFERHKVSALAPGQTLSIVLKGIKPQVTDPMIRDGGILQVRHSTANATEEHKMWLDMSLALVAEQLRLCHSIGGISFTRSTDAARSGSVISVWLATRDPFEVQCIRDDIGHVIPRAEHFEFTWTKADDVEAKKCAATPTFRRTNSAPNLDESDELHHQLDDDLMEDDPVLGAVSAESVPPAMPPSSDSARATMTTSGSASETSTPTPGTEGASKRKKAPPALDPSKVPTAERNTVVATLLKPPSSTPVPAPKRKVRSRSQGQSKEFVATVRYGNRRKLLGFKSLPVTPCKFSPEAIGPKKKVDESAVSNSATPIAHFKVIAPTPVMGLWSDAPWTPSYLHTPTPHHAAAVLAMSKASNGNPTPPLALGAFSTQPHQPMSPVGPKSVDPAAAASNTGRIVPLPAKSTSAVGGPTTSVVRPTVSVSPPPEKRAAAHNPIANPSEGSRGQAVANVVPSPSAISPDNSKIVPHHENVANEVGPTGDIVAAAFVFCGWLYPEGLNRKTRRKIQFSPEFIPTEIEGAIYVGMEVPDNNVSPETAAKLIAAQKRAPTMDVYVAKRQSVLDSKMKDKHPAEPKPYTPPKAPPRSIGPVSRSTGSPYCGRGGATFPTGTSPTVVPRTSPMQQQSTQSFGSSSSVNASPQPQQQPLPNSRGGYAAAVATGGRGNGNTIGSNNNNSNNPQSSHVKSHTMSTGTTATTTRGRGGRGAPR
eukprot:PhM_4_TR11821/c0_g1_i1/m.7963